MGNFTSAFTVYSTDQRHFVRDRFPFIQCSVLNRFYCDDVLLLGGIATSGPEDGASMFLRNAGIY
jgi:hypothetical protein